MEADTELPTLVFSTERITDALLAEVKPLAQAHLDEVGCFPGLPFNPDYDFYKLADKHGIIQVYTARLNDKLVGYSTFLVHKHPHYGASIQAMHDLLFLDPAYRSGSNGYNFLKFCDGELARLGVEVILFGVSARLDLSPLLRRLGYELVQQSFARRTN